MTRPITNHLIGDLNRNGSVLSAVVVIINLRHSAGGSRPSPTNQSDAAVIPQGRPVVARLSESFLRDVHLTEKSKELYDTDKTTWETVRDSLKDITSRIKRWFGKLSPDSTLGKIGEQMAAKNQEILDRFVAGVRAASENAAYTKNTTDEGGVRLMARENYEKADSNQDIIRIANGVLSGKYNQKEYAVLGNVSENNVAQAIQDILGVDVSDYRIAIETRQIQHIIKDHGLNGKTDSSMSDVNDIAKMGYILHNPDYISYGGKTTAYNQMINGRNKSADTVIYEKVIDEDSKRSYYVVQAVIDTKAKTIYIVTAFIGKSGFNRGKIKETPQVTSTTNRPGVTSDNGSVEVSTDIIPDSSEKGNTSDKKRLEQSRDADYLSAVKRGDMETAQRMVDEAAERAFANSKIRGEDGKLIKVYHGTYADFTVFDKAMGRSSADIQGMFFSPWDIDAGGYGQNVRAFYLNITNPADESTGYKALNAHKSENYAGIKAREDLEKAGYDGVNNSEEEYIAFTSAQIKSADPVTYDDNGEVIPLSQRFNTENKDTRFDSRDDWMDLIGEDEDLLFSEYDDISDMVAHQYTTHSEAIGEVLRNTADIDIAAGKVRNIVSHLFNARYSNIDAQTKKMLLYFCGLCGTINTDYLTGGILYDHQRRYHRRRT